MSDQRTYSAQGVICRYCKHWYKAPHRDADGRLYNKEIFKWRCSECGKESSVRVYVSHCWVGEKLEGDA